MTLSHQKLSVWWMLIHFGFLLSTIGLWAGQVDEYAKTIAPLIDPAKLATLRERGANPRVQKYIYWLASAKFHKSDAKAVAERAVEIAGYKGEAAKLTVEAMLRNLSIAERLGCTNEMGKFDMRRGQSPTIQVGPYNGMNCRWIT